MAFPAEVAYPSEVPGYIPEAELPAEAAFPGVAYPGEAYPDAAFPAEAQARVRAQVSA